MEDNTNLFWFGFLVEFVFILAIVKLVDAGSKSNGKLDAERNRLKRDYQRLEQELQLKTELMQENLRLQALRQRTDQVMQQPHQLELLSPEPATSETLELQAALQKENDRLSQECLRLQQALQQQEIALTTTLRHSLFKQLQVLFTHYPSVNKIIETRPDLPAKNVVPMFVPLENLVQSWGYEQIGAVWEQVAYDPTLHQPDTPDIEAGELVYVRFVGYRDGSIVLSPAKVSRTLTKTIGA
ncbi:XRE family transcriptional regulator [Leptolyngbya sp. FACHB-321]|uniref:XRE family transcriptional regulator n=1 Tax=Leptolyngbya sp. FACHB-321 TaxID=2692807 RepID=UPI001687DD53|nr:XRE family transcriptional regulator [Leptolyngbya sp. FACHB-321]MBD2035167.1 XRE family transcriptional regulator [Leptolyngbya sp. FACHB-321]